MLAPPAAPVPATAAVSAVPGFRDFARQGRLDAEFLAVPEAALAGQHLRAMASAPHWASSPADYATALYVAARFKAAHLQTEIVPYRVLMNRPVSIQVVAYDAAGRILFTGPTPEPPAPAEAAKAAPEHPGRPRSDGVDSDAASVPIAFNGSSPSGDVTAAVVYANYGRVADFDRLAELGVSVKGKIVLVRYGGAFRGVKVYLAEQRGASGVLLYSDPEDAGVAEGQTYPDGPYRPDSAAQWGSVQFLPIYPGDPTTPGVASVPSLPDARRIPVDRLQYDQPTIPVTPLSAADALPILQAMGGPQAPRDWQGGLRLSYRTGGSGVTVHMKLVQEARLRTIWDVIGRVPGTVEPQQWVVAGNHRDAWMYGAADPGSGTAALLEAVHGLGVLLDRGWRPRRTIVVASWDAEEEGLMGSTEWAEDHAAELSRAVAYFNIDVAVSGPSFNAAAVPSLRPFIRQIAQEVTSPAGGTVYSQWRRREDESGRRGVPQANLSNSSPADAADDGIGEAEVHLGDLGSGSDYTPFLQHFGVPATDIGSSGPFGVYHTVDDNYDWFIRFADPKFLYIQQQARIFGLEVLHMADADVLPYDYRVYGTEIRSYLEQARSAAVARGLKLDFGSAMAAAQRFEAAGAAMHPRQVDPPRDPTALDRALCLAEHALLIPQGLPRRPWYRHSIYAPGEFTGYSAVAIPGVQEGIEASDAARAQAQLIALQQALDRAAAALEAAMR